MYISHHDVHFKYLTDFVNYSSIKLKNKEYTRKKNVGSILGCFLMVFKIRSPVLALAWWLSWLAHRETSQGCGFDLPSGCIQEINQ